MSAADVIRAIEENPDDRDACAVYADWLLEQHEPLGEIMALALQKDVSSDRDFKTLTWKYCREHFAFLEPALHEQWTWSNGLIRGMSLSTHRTAEAVNALATTPAARFVRELDFTVCHRSREKPDPPHADDFPRDPIPLLVEAPFARTLRKLVLSLQISRLEPSWKTKNLPVDLNPLYPQLGDLEDLTVGPPLGGLGMMDLPSLRSLTTVLWTKDTAAELACANLPNLESLRFEWGKWLLLAGLDIPSAPKLEHLSLGWFDEDLREEAYAVMAVSPLVQRAQSLALPKIAREDTALLLGIAPALDHLREIRVPLKPFKKNGHREELTRVFGARLVLE